MGDTPELYAEMREALLYAELHALRADNDRMREALQKIITKSENEKPAKSFYGDSFSEGYCEGLSDAAKFARDILRS